MRDLPGRGLAVGALLIVAATVTSSCATMSPKQCLSADWRSVGYGDGASGYLMSRIDQHGKACAKSGVAPDPVLYAQGRDEGLVRYCTEASGFSHGRDGSSYQGVCPASTEPAFMGGYADGKRVYEAQHRLEQARSDRDSADRRAEKRGREADGVEDELRNPKLTSEQTRELRDRLNRLRRERREAIEDGRRAGSAIRDAEREVDDLKQQLGGHYGWW